MKKKEEEEWRRKKKEEEEEEEEEEEKEEEERKKVEVGGSCNHKRGGRNTRQRQRLWLGWTIHEINSYMTTVENKKTQKKPMLMIMDGWPHGRGKPTRTVCLISHRPLIVISSAISTVKTRLEEVPNALCNHSVNNEIHPR